MRKYLITLIILAVSLPLFAGHKKLENGNDIRVAIAHSLSFADISGGLIIKPTDTRKDKRVITRQARIVAEPNGFAVNETRFECRSLTVKADSGFIGLNGRKYSGELRIYKEPSGTMSIVNALPMEDYLAGIVGSEMPPGWPAEALKAQSVASRTYASFQRKPSAEYDLEATVLDQVFQGSGVVDERVRNAVDATRGEVMKKDGALFKAFFHSTCGGATESPLNVWNERPFFPVLTDAYCRRSPHNAWRYSIARTKLAEKLRAAGFPAVTVDSIVVERRKDEPRAATVIADTGGQTIYVQATDLRKLLGYDNLKSTWFNAGVEGSNVVFAGRGYGHGVGLCQWGAKGMADAGKKYREILEFYYPGAEIVQK